MLSAHVVLIIFNRPDLTKQSFAAIRDVQPENLVIIADGPRETVISDEQTCLQARKETGEINWPCNVRRIYADTNMGLKRRIVSGLTEVFRNAPCAIVIEDDCVLHRDYFTFAQELLLMYSECPQVWSITADNFQEGNRFGFDSYYFSKYSHCWGWATWRRAWQAFDPDITFWPSLKTTELWCTIHTDLRERRYWESIMDACYAGQIDSWAYPWMLNMWFSGGLTATPQVNLATNIGFGSSATHTQNSDRKFEMMRAHLGPLSHPSRISPRKDADKRVFQNVFQTRPEKRKMLLYRLWSRLRHAFSQFKT